MTTSPRDDLAAKHFPLEWARIKNLVGGSKQRQKMRQRAGQIERLRELETQGASCKTCDMFSRSPVGLKFTHYCDLYSDFHGYVETGANDLCHLWTTKEISP